MHAANNIRQYSVHYYVQHTYLSMSSISMILVGISSALDQYSIHSRFLWSKARMSETIAGLCRVSLDFSPTNPSSS